MAIRNRGATILRLVLAPLVFIFLAWVTDKAITSDSDTYERNQDVPNPPVQAVKPIPSCEQDLYTKTPCYDFLYTPNNNSIINVRTLR